MKISASAPTKVIISGEHAVVHGCVAIATPLENRNLVSVETTDEKKVEIKQSVLQGFDEATNKKLSEALQAEFLFVNPSKGVVFDRRYSGMPKGCGNSASIAAAFALCLYAIDDRIPSSQELFDAIQAFDKVMHANASGIDAKTVSSGSALVMKKEWNSEGVKFDFQHQNLVLPTGTVLLIIDRSGLGETAVATGELVTLFSQKLVGKNPNDVSDEDRRKMIAPFEPVVKAIIEQLHEDGNAKKLGELFVINNTLLSRGGVIPESMMNTVKECIQAGCLGAKGTGACGPGGAVIAIAWEKDVPTIKQKLEANGKYKVLTATFAKQGPRVESRE
ncbi:MAG: hypothetical protein QXR53_04870 [Candidatus Norongarragalinales archaeon]